MDRYDEETERYLREFHPRAVRPLALAPKAGSIFSFRRLAVAAAAVVLVAATVWFTHRETTRRGQTVNLQSPMTGARKARRYVTTVELTRLALEDSEKLDAVLADESRSVLPAVQGKQSTLKVLAKD